MEAFVTLVTSDSFVVGVEVLACSLRKTGTLRPLVVLYTPQLTPSAVEKLSSLSSHIFGVRASEDGSANQDEGEWPMKEISRLQAEKEFCVILHRVGPLPNPHEKCVHVDGWVNSGFTKLRIWQLTVFSQVVYVDADCVVCEAIDDLFDLERSEVWHPSCPPSRVLNGNCDDDRSGGTKGKEAAEKELKPVEQNERKPKGSPQQGRVLMSNGGGECEEEEEKCGDTAKDDEERRGSRKEARQITRLPAFAPDVCPPDKFNAGVVVLDPDANLFEQMMDAVDNLGSHDEGDTGFLNSFFPDWWQWPPGHRLHFRYNAQRIVHWMTWAKQPGYWKAVEPIKVIHFSSSPKPWESPDKKGPLELVWWGFFFQAKMGGGGAKGTAGGATEEKDSGGSVLGSLLSALQG